jgi:hypothetical protein
MNVLKRSAIIGGKKEVGTYEFERAGGALRLRPLTDIEMQKVTARMKSEGIGETKINPIMKNGVVDKEATMNNVDVKFNVETAQMAAYSASRLAIVISLDNEENTEEEKFTEEELGKFPAGSVDEIASKVFEISGVKDIDPERMKQFRPGE